MNDSYDVAVIGYGPVGQFAALLLGRAGHRVGVFERYPEPYPLPRAVHYDDEVARIFQAAGLSKALAPITAPVSSYEWRNAAGETLLKFDWTGSSGPSGWPASTMFAQPELEAVLDTAVRATPTVEVHRGCEVTEVDSGGTLTLGDGRQVTARYVVAADGANSETRRQLGLPVNDLGFTYDWLVVDAVPREERVWDPPAWQLCDPERPTTLVPGGPGRRRFEFMRLAGERVEELATADSVWRLLAAYGLTPANSTLERYGMYTFRALWAEQWRSDRVLLAGDAAHLMPPFAGQGLCAGMRDVANLAWKLDLVLDGRAPERLLDSYTSERVGHVQVATTISVELGKIVCVTDPEAARARDDQMVGAAQQLAPGAPPSLPIGPGVRAPDDANAGMLFPQGRVRSAGETGLFGDLVPARFLLLAHTGRPTLRAETYVFLEQIGGAVAWLGDTIVDIDGTYQGWFNQTACSVVLVRPDFAIFGTAPTLDGADGLVSELRRQLTDA